ncbi:hypothetical protein [uncultured Tenacibaculum sp.]|uniref:hypothetical protein n=1 Tax=uncultured Tenacibaculum sp. TaxID=174713 RepID=UPI0026262A5A|nr:hypothetical protein [uncultured Tenacibaculum sp.]
MIRKIILLVLLSFIGCQKEIIKGKVIEGDWFIYSLNTTESNNNSGELFSYSEVFFDGEKMFCYSNLKGGLPSVNYKIAKKKIFFHYDGYGEEYIGEVNFQGNDTLYIEGEVDTLRFYRIVNDDEPHVMSTYLKESNHYESTEFLNSFMKRVENCFNQIQGKIRKKEK